MKKILNCYSCPYGHRVITLQPEDMDMKMPYTIPCLKNHCSEVMYSSFFIVPAKSVPTHEWLELSKTTKKSKIEWWLRKINPVNLTSDLQQLSS